MNSYHATCLTLSPLTLSFTLHFLALMTHITPRWRSGLWEMKRRSGYTLPNTCPIQIAHSMLDKKERGYVSQGPMVSSCTFIDRWDRSLHLTTGEIARAMRWRLSRRDTVLINEWRESWTGNSWRVKMDVDTVHKTFVHCDISIATTRHFSKFWEIFRNHITGLC